MLEVLVKTTPPSPGQTAMPGRMGWVASTRIKRGSFSVIVEKLAHAELERLGAMRLGALAADHFPERSLERKAVAAVAAYLKVLLDVFDGGLRPFTIEVIV
jgi:hypothetical protein